MKRVIILTALALTVSALPLFAKDKDDDNRRSPSQNFTARRQAANPVTRGEQRKQQPNICPHCGHSLDQAAPRARLARRGNRPQPGWQGRGFGPQARGDRPQFGRDMRGPGRQHGFGRMQRGPEFGPQRGMGWQRFGPQGFGGRHQFGPGPRGQRGSGYGRGGFCPQRGMRGPGFGPQGFGRRHQFGPGWGGPRGQFSPGGFGRQWGMRGPRPQGPPDFDR